MQLRMTVNRPELLFAERVCRTEPVNKLRFMLRRLNDCRTSAAKSLPCAESAAELRTEKSRCGNRRAIGLLALMLTTLVGCQGANHYYAEHSMFGNRLPNELRVASRANTKTIDLSRLASGTGGSDRIGIGDLLEVQIAAGLSEDDQSKMSARVQNDGTITLPEIGIIEVGGLEPQGAESLIRTEAIRTQNFINPTVAVSVVDKRMNRVRVIGAVKAPGTYELSPNASDVVSAIAAAQGLADDAGPHVEVRNPAVSSRTERPAIAGDPNKPYTNVSSPADTSDSSSGAMESYSIDLISAAKAGDGQYLVQDGGVIMVEQSDPAPVYVQGLVKAAGKYEFPIGQDLRLLDAISLASGMSNQLANKIYIVRQQPGAREPIVIEAKYRDAKRSADSNIMLQPGDVVSVEQTPGTVFMEALNIIRFGVSGSTALF